MIERIGPVDITEMVRWITAIPFSAWPQQSRDKIKPAMVTDYAWHGFGQQAWPVIEALGFDESQAHNLMLSAVMPGDEIPPHCDQQPDYWLYRVHVPLLSNYRSAFCTAGRDCILMPGIAYKVNTRAEHAVYNRGAGPRVHFMFDVWGE